MEGENNMALCPNCGIDVKPNVRFCRKCGASLNASATHPKPPHPTNSKSPSGSFSVFADWVHINGEHFTVSNGYTSKTNGKVDLPISSILAVECVKRKPKRVMYAMLLIMGIAMAIITPIINVFKAISGMVNDFFWGSVGSAAGVGAELDMIQMIPGVGLPNVMPEPEFGGFSLMEILAIIFIIFAIPATIIGVIYFFTGRRYVEITTMKGIYRIAIPRGDVQMENTAQQLQRQI
jgi:hypothetical protein